MSTKFTPGEWRVCELTRRYGVYDSSGTSIAKIDGAYGVAMERRKADAHLIAAAPDGLVAASNAYMLILRDNSILRHSAAGQNTLCLLRDFIAKALNEDAETVQNHYESAARGES